MAQKKPHPKKQRRFESADKFTARYRKNRKLKWACPQCKAGDKDDPNRADARFIVALAQWYRWSIDATGERRTRHTIVQIDPPTHGTKVTCEQCNHEFEL